VMALSVVPCTPEVLKRRPPETVKVYAQRKGAVVLSRQRDNGVELVRRYRRAGMHTSMSHAVTGDPAQLVPAIAPGPPPRGQPHAKGGALQPKRPTIHSWPGQKPSFAR
jgi:hypothetical protein